MQYILAPAVMFVRYTWSNTLDSTGIYNYVMHLFKNQLYELVYIYISLCYNVHPTIAVLIKCIYVIVIVG